MLTDVIHEHITNRLKIIHLSGIGAMIAFFFLLGYLGSSADIPTLSAQMILLFMALLTTLGYVAMMANPRGEPRVPLLIFFALNLCTTALVWATGVLQSPFIILYVILIIITSQLYRYGYGLAQTILALAGFVSVYAAVVQEAIPFYPLLAHSNISLLFQPPAVIFVYGLLYAILFLFTVLSSSSARTLLFRPMNKVDFDTTYQEKIIQDMPLGVVIADKGLHLLGNNAAAAAKFPVKIAGSLADTVDMPKEKLAHLLDELASSHKEKTLSWKLDTGSSRPVTVSVRRMPGAKKDDATYILFLQ